MEFFKVDIIRSMFDGKMAAILSGVVSVVFFVNWSGLVGLGFRVIGGGWGGARVFFGFIVCIVVWGPGYPLPMYWSCVGFRLIGSTCFCLGFA